MKQLEKFLDNKHFIKWIFSSDAELDLWWKNFEQNNTTEQVNLQLAGKILQMLHTKDKDLSEDERLIIFSNILEQVNQRKQKRKFSGVIQNSLKYAAVAFMFFALGALLFYQKNNFNSNFVIHEISEPINSDEARLVRPEGEILLNEVNSHIEHRSNGKVVVNDKIVETLSDTDREKPKMNQLIIPHGKRSEIILPDGSHVFLNAGSRLIYPDFFAEKTREVFLLGEAFFDVKHNKKQPFVVQTTDIRIRVLGTEFNIAAYPSDNTIETVLASGKVRLEPNKVSMLTETIELGVGQLGTYNKSERTTQINNIELENYILWKDGLLKFESTNLSRIIKKLERYYNIRFRYSDPFVGNIQISGKLDLNNTRELVLDNFADAASIQITTIGEGYYEINK